MSGGGGGYYKFRCKNWLSHDCPNWVWVNGSSCAACLSNGRGSGVNTTPHVYRLAREIYVPQVDNGTLHYTLMEIIVDETPGSRGGWELKDKPAQDFPNPSGANLAMGLPEVSSFEDHGALKSGERP